MTSKALIHIGYHKTGTSFLQKRIFESYPSVFHRVRQTAIRDHLITPSPFLFSEASAIQFCQEEMNYSDALYAVFSNEFLSSNPHGADSHSKYVADRLKACMPDSQILIVIREQASMVYSSYAQYLRARGSYGIRDYIYSPIDGRFRLDHLQYHHLIGYYFDLFGKRNVLVLPYELLKASPVEFLEKLFAFLDIDELLNSINFDAREKVNQALSPCQLLLKRYMNPFIERRFENAGSAFYNPFVRVVFGGMNRILAAFPMRALNENLSRRTQWVIDESIKYRFEESNRATGLLIGVDLSKYGYRT